jgi:hypothetical protein
MFRPFSEANNLEPKPIIKSINILNGCLIGLALLLVYTILFPQPVKNGTYVLPLSKKKPAEKIPAEAPKSQNLSPMDYVAIADDNLFHPERRMPPEKKDEAALPKPEFVLYGTLITSQTSMAYMEDKKAPVTTPGRGKRQTVLKKGESLSGFTLKEVLNDKVVMTRGQETLTVLLHDPQAQKIREAAGGAGSQPQSPKGPVPSPPAGRPVPGGPGAFPSPGIPTPPPVPPQAAVPPGIGPSVPPPGTIPPGQTRTLPPMMP